MTAPRRYRLALCAYPARYRTSRGAELLSTLADGDDDRGHASSREALALAYRGLLERGRIAVSADGLLVWAAALVLFAMFFGLTWAERVYLFRGEAAAMGTDGPGQWAAVALFVSAVTILAAGSFRAVESPRRRRIVAVIAFIVALIIWPAPGGVFKYSIPDAAELAEHLRFTFTGIYSNWALTLPFAATAAAGTWLALQLLSELPRSARRPALAAGLLATGAIAVILTWTRPDLVAPYGRDAFSDLGAAVFVTACGMLLALAAAARRGSTRA